MAEVIEFSDVARRAIRRVLVAAVDDGLEKPLPLAPVRVDVDVAVRYLRTSEVLNAGHEPDLWIERHAPSAPDRRVLFETLAGEVVEQDERGTLWIDEAPLGPGALVSVGSAEHDSDRPLAPGDCAALLFMTREPASFQFAVEITAPILWVFEQPTTLAAAPVLIGWTGAARCLWLEREKRSG